MARISFEVFGKVQGVFFRKYTKKKADFLKITGWVQNTSKGTVIGEASGGESGLKLFEQFLRSEGSPKSRIEACEIKKLSDLATKYPDFCIIRK